MPTIFTEDPQFDGVYVARNARFSAVIKAMDNPSLDYGLLGGCVVKLLITDDGLNKHVFSYDRGFGLDDLDVEGRNFLREVVSHFDVWRMPTVEWSRSLLWHAGFCAGLLSGYWRRVLGG